MKKILICLLLLFSVISFAQQIPKNPNKTDKKGLRQGKWTIWFNKDSKHTQNKDSISYYRLINYKGDKPVGLVTDYYLNGKKQFEGQLLADRPKEILEGKATWFRENGTKETERIFKKGEIISEKNFSVDGIEVPPEIMQAYKTAQQFKRQGKYDKAIQYYEEAINIYKQKVSDQDEDYATLIHNLAGLYNEQGNYAKAEPLFLEALKIKEKTLGKEHPNYANSLNHLAFNYYTQGNYTKAEPLYLEALKIIEKALGKEQRSYVSSLNNLALIYYTQGNYAKAEPLYLEALKIIEKALGREHPDYAGTLNYLAELYRRQGNYAKAEPLYLEALKIREKVLGKEHPYYAFSLNDLAMLYRSQGNYAKAGPLYLEALKIKEKTLGKEHTSYAESLNNLAELYKSQGNYAKAEPLLLEAHEVYFKLLEKQFPQLSEKEKGLFFETFNYNFESFNSFALKYKALKPAVIATVFDNQLATKALLFNTANKIRDRILNSKNQALIDKYQNWLSQKNFLSKAYSLSQTQKQKQGIDLPTLENNANALEKELSAQSEDFAGANDKKRYIWQDVRKILKPNEVAIEMVRFRWYNKKMTDTVYYAALIVTPTSKLPEWVLLENGNDLESNFISYYRSRILRRSEDRQSYLQFWKPIADKLKRVAPACTKIYFSPDGVYNQLNLSTLLNPGTKKYLDDEIEIQLLTSSKDLLVKPLTTIKSAKGATLIGFPDYNNNPQKDTLTDKDRSFASTRSADDMRDFFEKGSVADLPGTKTEVNNIGKLLADNQVKTNIWIAGQANEASLKKLFNPRILHIATHGFFFQDVSRDNKEEQGFGKLVAERGSENPLFRSGLLLAGCTTSLKGQESTGGEDGILTAYEAMNLNLDNTDLVVLSACETGLGEIRNGEGVYGLQRAFKVAGAKTIIMSLWKVSDEATQELMTSFYENWLKTGNKRQAFTQAQNTLKAKYKAPYFWGAFVMVGE